MKKLLLGVLIASTCNICSNINAMSTEQLHYSENNSGFNMLLSNIVESQSKSEAYYDIFCNEINDSIKDTTFHENAFETIHNIRFQNKLLLIYYNMLLNYKLQKNMEEQVKYAREKVENFIQLNNKNIEAINEIINSKLKQNLNTDTDDSVILDPIRTQIGNPEILNDEQQKAINSEESNGNPLNNELQKAINNEESNEIKIFLEKIQKFLFNENRTDINSELNQLITSDSDTCKSKTDVVISYYFAVKMKDLMENRFCHNLFSIPLKYNDLANKVKELYGYNDIKIEYNINNNNLIVSSISKTAQEKSKKSNKSEYKIVKQVKDYIQPSNKKNIEAIDKTVNNKLKIDTNIDKESNINNSNTDDNLIINNAKSQNDTKIINNKENNIDEKTSKNKETHILSDVIFKSINTPIENQVFSSVQFERGSNNNINNILQSLPKENVNQELVNMKSNNNVNIMMLVDKDKENTIQIFVKIPYLYNTSESTLQHINSTFNNNMNHKKQKLIDIEYNNTVRSIQNIFNYNKKYIIKSIQSMQKDIMNFNAKEKITVNINVYTNNSIIPMRFVLDFNNIQKVLNQENKKQLSQENENQINTTQNNIIDSKPKNNQTFLGNIYSTINTCVNFVKQMFTTKIDYEDYSYSKKF